MARKRVCQPEVFLLGTVPSAASHRDPFTAVTSVALGVIVSSTSEVTSNHQQGQGEGPLPRSPNLDTLTRLVTLCPCR